MQFTPNGRLLFPEPEEDLADIAKLMKQLSPDTPARDLEYVRALLYQQDVHLAIRRGTTGRIIGVALLFINR